MKLKRSQLLYFLSHCFHLSVSISSFDTHGLLVRLVFFLPFFFLMAFVYLFRLKRILQPTANQIGLDHFQGTHYSLGQELGLLRNLHCMRGLAKPHPFSQGSHETQHTKRPKGWGVWEQVWFHPTPWENENWAMRTLVVMAAVCTNSLSCLLFIAS